MGKTVTLTIRVNPELIERINAASDNRNKFIIAAIEEKLNPVKADEELTDAEKRNALKGAKTLNDVMQDLILQEAARRKNFLSRMDDDTFAKLVAGRLPKETQESGELEEEVLSLQKCLDGLPDVEDVSGELNKAKGLLFKAEKERDFARALLDHAEGKLELRELMKRIYGGAVEYAVHRIIRGNLPGFGDGGGLTQAEYEEIGREISRELEELDVLK